MSTLSRSYRFGAAVLTLLVMVHAASSLVHACCLGHETAGSGHGMMAGHEMAGHEMARPAHAEHGPSDSQEEDDCGLCGFCCQPAGQEFLLVPTTATVASASTDAVADVVPAVEVVIATPAYVLPYPNGPPALL